MNGSGERHVQEKTDFFGKKNEFSGEQTKDKKLCDNVCLYRYEWSFRILQGHKTPLENRFWVSFELFLWEKIHP